MSRYPNILYRHEPQLSVDEFRRVLTESGLGATRPVDDASRLGAMLCGANLILTARLDEPGTKLVGVARGVTDFVWCCYLAELAVCASAQGMGVGRGLLDEARRQLGPAVSLILVSAPEAAGFYARAGMARVDNAFWFLRKS
jgi:ribosomal protein S18 acetylase RimI-like enzyme